MKKFILLILGVFVIATTTAQIQATHSSSSPTTIYGPRAGVSLNKWVFKGEFEYYLALNTTNQFDKTMIINLGSLEKAKISLNWFIENYVVDQNYTMKDDSGHSFKAICRPMFGVDGFAFFKEGYAGHAYIRLSDFKRIIKILNAQ